jgi:peptidyl-prolyl cis-trans isomerase B (cyclophilin B)
MPLLKQVIFAFLFVFANQYVLAQKEHAQVLISTNMGNITVLLYNDTPNHRDQFLKLVDAKHFDGTLFYRVVKDFVVQGGSSDSRNAPAGKHIGYGRSAVTIDSEFLPHRYHKKGVICAPRQPDDINHFKMSDISQFYIVHGKRYSIDELELMQKARNNPIMVELKKKHYLSRREELQQLKETDPAAFNKLLREIKEKIDVEYSLSNKLEFTEQQIFDYTSLGGCPELDNEYTVFGEVIKGLDVIDRIAALPVDRNNRPLKDIRMTVSIVYD